MPVINRKNYLLLRVAALLLAVSSLCSTAAQSNNSPYLNVSDLANSPLILSVGDRVPDITINKIINYPVSSTSLGKFKDKLVILDFMATSCVSCIKVLPRFDSLQKYFGDRLQIFLVTNEKPEKVKTFLQKNKIGRQINLAWIVEDSILKQKFPHQFISHEAWIYKGIVNAITRTEYVVEGNIETVLKNIPVNWPVKKDIVDYDANHTLFVYNSENIPAESFPEQQSYVSFTSSMQNIGRRTSFDQTRLSEYLMDEQRGTERIFMINFPIIDLYLKACSQPADFPISRIIIEPIDSNKFIYDLRKGYRSEWLQKNTYCYEAIFPVQIPDAKRKEKIRGDLDFYLGVHGRMEKRRVKCLVLVRSGSDSLLKMEYKRTQYNKEDTIKVTSISNLLYMLSGINYSFPVFDETRYSTPRYLQLNRNSVHDLPKLREELVLYGIDIKTEMREVDMLVLTEK